MSPTPRSRAEAAARLYRQHSGARRRATQRRGVPRRLRGRRTLRHLRDRRRTRRDAQDRNGPDPLFRAEEARALAPAAETVFLGLAGEAGRFGIALDPEATKATEGAARSGRHRPALDRRAGTGRPRASRAARRGEGAARLACAPSLLRQLRRADQHVAGRLEARMPGLQGRAFPAHRSGRDHAGDRRRTLPARPRRAFRRRTCGRALRASSSRARASRRRRGARRWRKPASPAGG